MTEPSLEGARAAPGNLRYQPETLADPVQPAVAALAEVAAQRVLVLCIGAGVSIGKPTGLPPGKDIASRLHSALCLSGHKDSVGACDPSDLICIADKMEEIVGGADLVQSMLRELADFTGAHPNYSHEVLALLVMEGAIELISLNWDTCVERSPRDGERLEVVVSAEDFRNVSGPRFHKVHGCVARGPLLAVSSRQLADVPQWVLDELGGRLARAEVAFVGVGDIPSYVNKRIAQLKQQMLADRIYVVDPKISDAWKELVPELTEERKLGQPADRFLDSLLRGYVNAALRHLFRELQDPNQVATYRGVGVDISEGSKRLRAALDLIDARSFVVFCRQSRYGWTSPDKVVQSPELLRFLAAAAALASKAEVRFDPHEMRLQYAAPGGRRYAEPVLARGQSGAAVARAAHQRVQLAASEGRYAPGDRVILIVEGHLEPLPLPSVPASMIGEEESGELIAGSTTGQVRLMSATDLLRGGVPPDWEAA